MAFQICDKARSLDSEPRAKKEISRPDHRYDNENRWLNILHKAGGWCFVYPGDWQADHAGPAWGYYKNRKATASRLQENVLCNRSVSIIFYKYIFLRWRDSSAKRLRKMCINKGNPQLIFSMIPAIP